MLGESPPLIAVEIRMKTRNSNEISNSYSADPRFHLRGFC